MKLKHLIEKTAIIQNISEKDIERFPTLTPGKYKDCIQYKRPK